MAKRESETSEAPAAKKRGRRPGKKRGLVGSLTELFAESFPKLTKVLKLAFDWTRRKSPWIRYPLYAVLLIGAALWGFRESLMKLPGSASFKHELDDRIEDIFAALLPKADGKEFVIAIARIEGDDGSVGNLLSESLT